MYYLTEFLWGRGLGTVRPGGSGLGSFMRLQSRYQPGVWSPEDLTGAGRSPSFKVAGKLVLASAGGLSFSPLWDLSLGLLECLHNLVVAASQVINTRAHRRSHSAFCDLASEVTHGHCRHHILFVGSQSLNRTHVPGGRDKAPPFKEKEFVDIFLNYRIGPETPSTSLSA